jgi:hypothetical protein
MSGIYIKRSQVRTPAQKIKMCFKTCPKTKIQVEIWQNFPENTEDVTNFMLPFHIYAKPHTGRKKKAATIPFEFSLCFVY